MFTKARRRHGEVSASVKSRSNHHVFYLKFYLIIQSLSDLTSSWISVIRVARQECRTSATGVPHKIVELGKTSAMSQIKLHTRFRVRRLLGVAATKFTTALTLAPCGQWTRKVGAFDIQWHQWVKRDVSLKT